MLNAMLVLPQISFFFLVHKFPSPFITNLEVMLGDNGNLLKKKNTCLGDGVPLPWEFTYKNLHIIRYHYCQYYRISKGPWVQLGATLNLLTLWQKPDKCQVSLHRAWDAFKYQAIQVLCGVGTSPQFVIQLLYLYHFFFLDAYGLSTFVDSLWINVIILEGN